MNDHKDTQAITDQPRSRKTNKQNSMQPSASKRPANNDKEAWKAYWRIKGQPWRTEPEIDIERQKRLSQLLRITPNIERGIYPFCGIKLDRADIEWLLAIHENGLGPVCWSDESQRERRGLDIRGADLRQADLRNLPLARLCAGLPHWEWAKATLEQRTMAVAQLGGANLRDAQLAGAYMRGARLAGTYLSWAQLEKADLNNAQLKGAHLRFARLERADLRDAQLAEADIRGAQLEGAILNNAVVGDDRHIGPLVADTLWDSVNLAAVKWSLVNVLGDEHQARQMNADKGEAKDKAARLEGYESAIRANRQLAVALQAQGLNEDAARFAYRAQKLQRIVFRRQKKFGEYLFSGFLDLLTGYGYKPLRSFITYLIVITVFAIIYHCLSPHLVWNEAMVISMTAFHGRGFFPDQFKPDDPQALVAAIEAFVGLLIEVTFIATLTQRLFGR